MNFARTIPSGYISSQKYVDSQTGTNNIPFALQSFRCQIIKPQQETRNKKQETRNKKQETRNKKLVDKASFVHLSNFQ